MRRVETVINGKKGYIMAQAGRKRKTDVERHQCGKIVQPTEAQVEAANKAFIASQPHRKGSTDPRAGYAHGRMRLGGVINQRQFEAAEVFMQRAIAYMAAVSGGVPRFPSVSADMVARGIDCKADMTDERIAQIRSDYAEVQDALSDGGLHHAGNSLLVRVCIMDKDLVSHREIGDFRCSLNLIAHRLRLA
jgi:hypothetical protein